MEIGTIVHRFKTCSSTNDLAREMALAGAKEGEVVVSEEQTKGRGTKGRKWHSAKGMGLYASIILYPKQSPISLLPLVAGLAAKDAVSSSTGLPVALRWPNDIVWRKKKLGGILCESGFLGNRLNYVILGIGLNTSHEKNDFPPDIRALATSLKLATSKTVERSFLLGNLCKALNYWYALFSQGQKDEIIHSFEENLIFSRGDRLTVVKNGEVISGIFRGLDSEGGLILEVKGKTRSFYSAEIKKIEHEKGEKKCF